jgi:hypothetical protein
MYQPRRLNHWVREKMRRIALSLAFAVGMLLLGATSASAHTWCSVDPTVGVGTPLKYTVNLYVLGSNVYLNGTHTATTFEAGLGLP